MAKVNLFLWNKNSYSNGSNSFRILRRVKGKETLTNIEYVRKR